MKKNRLLKTLIIASFITYSLVSCSNNGNSNNSSNVETTTMDIDSINRIVFEEFKKSFPDATYDDFLLNSKKQESSVDITYKYLSSSIIVGLKGNFKSKDILITNDLGVKEKRTVYYYIKSNWVVVEDYIYVDDIEKETYFLALNSDYTYSFKQEYKYDEYGNGIEGKFYRYYDNEWILASEEVVINGSFKPLYTIELNDDGTFKAKFIYEYDVNGNPIDEIYFEYIDEWVPINKYSYTYDDSGIWIEDKSYFYFEDEWVLKNIFKNYNGFPKLVYTIEFNDDNTFKSKKEFDYDSLGNLLIEIEYDYENDIWVCKMKHEYTYDDIGNLVEENTYLYVDGEWVLLNN